MLGTNACYFENLDNVPKWTGARDSIIKQVVINTEWGALGKVCSLFGLIDSCIMNV
jgi:hexokinase